MNALIARVIAWALALKPTRVWLHYVEHRGFMLADSITYRALFSISAGVLLGFTLAARWLGDNPKAMQALIDAVDAVIPGLVGEGGAFDVSLIVVPASLTIAGVIALVALVGAAIGAIGSLRAAMRMLADEAHDDAFWIWVMVRNFLLALAIGGGFALSAAASMFGTVFVGALQDWWGIESSAFTDVVTGVGSVVIVFVLDTALLALVFVALSGVRARARTLWIGALLGGVGLTVLQQLSTLFVQGADNNPLLASFAALIALLLWVNLSSQVILIASTWIIIGAAEDHDRVRARHGAPTFEMRRVRKAEDRVRVATTELERAREIEREAREGSRE